MDLLPAAALVYHNSPELSDEDKLDAKHADYRKARRHGIRSREKALEEVERLTHGEPQKNQARDCRLTDQQMKGHYLTALISFYDKTDRTLAARVMELDKAEMCHQEQMELLGLATELCDDMACAFDRGIHSPTRIFRYAWKEFESILQRYPLGCTALGVVCGTLGGLAATGGLHLHVGLSAKMGAAFGSAAGPIGVAIGAFLGVALFAVGIWAWDRCSTKGHTPVDAEVQQRKDIEELLQSVSDSKVDTDDIRRLHERFSECLAQPLMDPQCAVGEECSICLAEFTRSDASRDHIARTPNCTGGHFFHRACLDSWEQCDPHGFTCPQCRQ